MTTQARPGGGRYDDILNLVRRKTNAKAVIIAIVGGSRGHGVASQIVKDENTQAHSRVLVDILRTVAADIETNLDAIEALAEQEIDK